MSPTTITSAAELDALPVGSVVRCDDAEGIGLNVAERKLMGWQYVGSGLHFTSAQVASDEVEFTVLYRPDEPQRVQTSRDEVARALFLHDHPGSEHVWGIPGDEGRAVWWSRAEAVLALLPGRTEAEVKAEALREAADAAALEDGTTVLGLDSVVTPTERLVHYVRDPLNVKVACGLDRMENPRHIDASMAPSDVTCLACQQAMGRNDG